MRSLLAVCAAVICSAFVAFAQQADVQSRSGHVVVARETLTFEKGQIYRLVAKGDGFAPRIMATRNELDVIYPILTFKEILSNKHWTKVHLVPAKSGDLSVYAHLDSVVFEPKERRGYKLDLTRIRFSKKPLIEKADSIAKNDPIHAPRDMPHKAYLIKATKGKCY
jgi:hypothetical protein